MSFLKRISDGIWSFVSPTKPHDGTRSTPQTAPNFQKKLHRAGRKASMEDVIRQSRSMSPIARVDSWHVEDGDVGKKRKQLPTLRSGGYSSKRARMDLDGSMGNLGICGDEDVQMGDEDSYDDEDEEVVESDEGEGEDEEVEYDEEDGGEGDAVGEEEEYDGYDAEEEEEEEEDEDLDSSNSHTSPGKGYAYDYDLKDLTEDTTHIVAQEEYETAPIRRKVVDIREEQANRGISTANLRAEGWCDDHITLVQKIVMRGFEPLLPHDFRCDFNYLPDVLYGPPEQAYINTIRGEKYKSRAVKALEKLMDLGGWCRDRCTTKAWTKVTPGQQIIRSVREYMKWADKDSNLDLKTKLKLLAFETKPQNTSPKIMEDNICRKMTRYYTKCETAFCAHKSIESSPLTDSTKLSYPIPQIYGLICSRTVALLVAYRPDTPEQQIRTVAFFDFAQAGYDAWNGLALAIIVNHVRNMQVRIAEETGVGMKIPGMEEPVDDPDL